MPTVTLKRQAFIPGRMFEAGEVADVDQETYEALKRAEVLVENPQPVMAASQVAPATTTEPPAAVRQPRK